MKRCVRNWGLRITAAAGLVAMAGCRSVTSNAVVLGRRTMRTGVVPAPYHTAEPEEPKPGQPEPAPAFSHPAPKDIVCAAPAVTESTVRPEPPTPVVALEEPAAEAEKPAVKESSASVEEPPEAPQWHVVQKGEILGRIARKYDVSVDQLVKWNGLESAHAIQAKRKLAVTAAAAAEVKNVGGARSRTLKRAIPASGVHKVKPNESWWSIAHSYHGLNSVKLREINAPKRQLHPGDIIRLTAVGGAAAPESAERAAELPANNLYTVRPGDTLSGIARKYRVSRKQLRRDNALKTDRLEPGKVLVVAPDKSSSRRARQAAPEQRDAGAQSPRRKTKDERVMLPHFVDPASDSLKGIADTYGSTVAWILEANPGIKSDADLKKVREILVPVAGLDLGRK